MTTVSKPSLARTYDAPIIPNVSTEIVADEEGFVPEHAGDASVIGLKANLSTPLQMPHRGAAEIDCGIKINLPAGFHPHVKAHPAWAGRGLHVSTYDYTEGRLKVSVINVGREILVIKPKDVFAAMSLQPVYHMDLRVGK